MPTSTTIAAGLMVMVYDDDAIQGEIAYPVYSEDSILQWESGRFQSREVRSEIGFTLDPYETMPSPIELSDDGVAPHRRDLLVQSLGYEHGSTNIYPKLAGGQYRMGNVGYVLRTNRRVAEVFNGTSKFFSTETARRHIFGQTPHWDEPITAIIYGRQRNGTPIPFRQWSLMTEFSIYPSMQSQGVYSDTSINYSILDDNMPECMVDYMLTGSKELVFNQDVNAPYERRVGWSPGSINEVTSVLPTLSRTLNPYIYMMPHWPVDTSSYILYGVENGVVTQWTQTSTFDGAAPGDKVYRINNRAGEVVINTAAVAYPHELYSSYATRPMIEYDLATFDGAVYEGKELPLGRISGRNQSSVLVTMMDLEALSRIQLSIEVGALQKVVDNWVGAYYGDPPIEIRVKAFFDNGEPASNIHLVLDLLNIVGALLGGVEKYQVSLLTDERGRATFYYVPPGWSDAQVTRWERNGSNHKKLDLLGSPVEHDFVGSIEDIYTYIIYKDDPLLGRIAHAQNPQDTIEWDAVRLNGRRLILSRYDPLAKHPVDDGIGAHVPVHPVTWDSTTITYADDLPVVDPLDDNNWLGGFAVMGPRLAKMRVSVMPLANVALVHAYPQVDFNVRVDLSAYARGVYSTGGNKYALGYRLPGATESPASQLGGALWYTINPVSGAVNILFESGQVQKATEAGFIIEVEVEVP